MATSRLEKDLLKNAFMMAAAANDLHAAQNYLAQGASIHTEDHDGNNALNWAARAGNTNMIAMLIKKNINANHRNNTGRTALMEAALYGQHAAVKKILSAGVDPNIKDCCGFSALAYAAGQKDISLLNIFLEKKDIVDINIQTDTKLTPLMLSITYDTTDLLQALIKAGADLNLKNRDGNTALAHTVMCGFTVPMHILINAGADISARNDKGHTAIDIAAQRRRHDVEKILKDALLEQIVRPFSKGLNYSIKAPAQIKFP